MLLIDVDGVISLWGWKGDQPSDGAWTLVEGVPHFLSAGAAGRIGALADACELWWCTGWEERANDHLLALVGSPPLPVLSFDRVMRGAGSLAHWKLAAIDGAAGPDRPLAWIDDAFNPACHAWAAARPGPTLLVTTAPAEGFTDEQARAVRAWATRVRCAPCAD